LSRNNKYLQKQSKAAKVNYTYSILHYIYYYLSTTIYGQGIVDCFEMFPAKLDSGKIRQEDTDIKQRHLATSTF
jgi:hypothetical protein